MKKLAQIEKIIPLIGNMLLPAFLFACALLSFCLQGTFSNTATSVFHTGFYLLSFIGFLTLLYCNRGKPVFIFLLIALAYMLINFLKHLFGAEYTQSAAYISLATLMPLNLLILYFLPAKRFFNKINIWILLGIFAQFSLAELLARHQVALGTSIYSPNTLNLVSLMIFIILLLTTLYNSAISGSIADYNYFFTSLSVCLAFYYSDSAYGLSIFCFCAVLISLSALAQIIYNETYKDTLTGLDSRNYYIIHSKNLPFKYCVGVISIDDYDKLGINFGRRIQNILTKLIARQIINLEKDENIYRYDDDKFVILYKNLDKNESFERLEIIRRAIVSAQFEFSTRHKPIKLTISAGVSEKKRSDANSFEVLARADKAMRKIRAFSHNVTSKA